MTITNTAVLPPAVAEYYDRVLLMTAYPALVHTRFGQHRKMPSKNGNTIVFRRYNRLDSVPIPLNDGVTPPGTTLSVNDIKATIDWYGNFVTITDQVQLTVEDQVLNESARLLSQNMAQSLDEVTRDVLVSTGSTYACQFGSNGGTPTDLTKEDLDTVVRTLLNQDTKMITEAVIGTDKLGTSPVRASFFAFASTQLIDDLEKISDWKQVSNYPMSDGIADEWGQSSNIRFLVTSQGYVSGDVYTVPVVGKEAYGVVSLGSDMGEMYVNPLGSGGSADPLAQRGSVGWKIPFVSRVLNDQFMVNVLTTHS